MANGDNISAAGNDISANAILQSSARFLNVISDGTGSKFQRKKALEGIRNETIDASNPIDATVLQAVFSEISRSLLYSFSDQAEKNRELAIQLETDFLMKIPEPIEFLPSIMPVLVQRLGQQDLAEGSEELRFLLIQLLSVLIKLGDHRIHVYLDDFVRILIRTIVDPYPEVKKESCRCASNLSKKCSTHFHMQSEALIKPLLLTMSHQHSRVRTAAVECLGDVIQNGNGKSVDDVVSHLAQRLFDQSPAVRKAVTQVVGGWLLDLRDRYSFHHKLIPLLLSSMSDDVIEVHDITKSLWHDIGLKYEEENEDDLKDKQDFMKPPPAHYPPTVERPNLGCRTLMFRHVSKILPALSRDLGDWVVNTRIKASQLMYHLILNAEEYITQHLELVLNALYKACCDEEVAVRANVCKVTELLGYFVEPSVWVKVVLPAIQSSQSYNHLMVLTGITSGSSSDQLMPYFRLIAKTISSPDVCHTSLNSVHSQLLSCVDGLMSVFKDSSTEQSYPLFCVLIAVSALCLEQDIFIECQRVLKSLADLHQFDSLQMLYTLHMKELITEYQQSHNNWTSLSLERAIFDKVLLDSGPVVGDFLDDIMPIFVACLHNKKDPEIRLKFFTLLSKLVNNSTNSIDSKDKFSLYAGIVVEQMVMPNCIWKAGKTAGAIRTIAVACLWTLFKSRVLSKETIEPMVNQLLTQLISLLDDTNHTTRLTASHTLTRLFSTMAGSLDMDIVHNMYPELLKRLDDSKDDIRLAICDTFNAYFGCFQNNYDVGLYKAHIEAIYRGLLVHMDDPEPKIQQAVFDVLKIAASIHPPLLKIETENVKYKHRTSKFCDELIIHIEKLRLEYVNSNNS
ncbi:dynein axonemal assembly factor 5-like [Tubulanus polymorphus]|uniref:dynein axonemal assembly factor 5-like n=1 Tax=Tubulanus polymorphus TaxID=672921 RepID=UPI003DA2CFBF